MYVPHTYTLYKPKCEVVVVSYIKSYDLYIKYYIHRCIPVYSTPLFYFVYIPLSKIPSITLKYGVVVVSYTHKLYN